MNMRTQIIDLGLIDYQEAYEKQKFFVEQVQKDGQQYLLLCEHPTVLTLGRMTKAENILLSKEQLELQGVKIYPIDRGGDVTLHSPGQLIIYPIFNLNNYSKDLKVFLNQLEQTAIELLSEFDILATRREGLTGVWVNDRKIVSLGIGVKKWVSFHGIGINVNTNLDYFSMIKPCGLNVTMTSMAKIKNRHIDMQVVKDKIVNIFEKQFRLKGVSYV